MPSKMAFSTLAQRIEWLLKHRELLVGRADKKKIVSGMKFDGLVSRKTYWPDVKLDDAIKQAKIRWFAEHNR